MLQNHAEIILFFISKQVYLVFVNINIVWRKGHTVKILKIGTPKIITVMVLQMEQLDFTVQYCVQKMQTE